MPAKKKKTTRVIKRKTQKRSKPKNTSTLKSKKIIKKKSTPKENSKDLRLKIKKKPVARKAVKKIIKKKKSVTSSRGSSTSSTRVKKAVSRKPISGKKKVGGKVTPKKKTKDLRLKTKKDKKPTYKVVFKSEKKSSSSDASIKPMLKKVNYSSVKKQTSKHVLNLKEIHFENEIEKHNKKDYAKQISSKLTDAISKKSFNINKFTKKAYTSLPTKKRTKSLKVLEFEYPKETKIIALEGHQLIEDSIKRQQAKKTKVKLYIKKIKTPTKYLKIELSTYAQKAIASFVIASFILTSPLMAFDYYQKIQTKKGKVLGVTYNAIEHLKTSNKTSEYKDYISTEYEIGKANENFKTAQKELKTINPIFTLIAKALPNSQYKSAQNLLNIGEKVTKLSQEALNIINNKNQGDLQNSLIDLIELLSNNKQNINDVINSLEKIDISVIPDKYQNKLIQIKAILPTLQDNVDELLANSKMIVQLLGKNEPKRYLLLFQNNNELRATGGFIGSYAELNLDKGKITNITVPSGGIYDLTSQLDKVIEPPKAISLINNKWEIQDTNYFPDFEKSAKITQNFYEHSGGTTTDGVISINATFISKLLKVTGPIELFEYDETVTSENFIKLAQYYSSQSEDKLNNKPKRFIATLTPKLINKIFNLDNISLIDLIKTLSNGLKTKEMQIYFSDKKSEDWVKDKNFAGNILDTSGDYLNIVSMNLSGAKNNLNIQDHISVKIDINKNGEAIHSVSLMRTNTSEKSDSFEGRENTDYLRFYVPFGSELISSNGFNPFQEDSFLTSDFKDVKYNDEIILENSSKQIAPTSKTEIFQDSGKTVFANWLTVAPGETKSVTIKYKTPKNLIIKKESKKSINWLDFILKEFNLLSNPYESYSLLIQKQSGKINQNYNLIINTPDSKKYVWAYPSQINIDSNQFSLVDYNLTKDLFIAIVLDEK